jgi:hypothetical protein
MKPTLVVTNRYPRRPPVPTNHFEAFCADRAKEELAHGGDHGVTLVSFFEQAVNAHVARYGRKNLSMETMVKIRAHADEKIASAYALRRVTSGGEW